MLFKYLCIAYSLYCESNKIFTASREDVFHLNSGAVSHFHARRILFDMPTGYVYVLSCEPHSDKYYIGITTQKLAARLSGHLYDTRYKDRYYPKTAWVKSLLNRGLSPTITAIQTVECNTLESLRDALNDLEVFYIQQFKKWNLKLVNHGNGGKLNIGRKLSEQAKAKLSKAHTGKTLSESHRLKISIANKGIIQSEEKRQRISATLTGHPVSKEEAEAFRKRVKKYIHKNTFRSKISESIVFEIVALLKQGVKHKVIAKHYNISASNVSAISTRRGWKHLWSKHVQLKFKL